MNTKLTAIAAALLILTGCGGGGGSGTPDANALGDGTVSVIVTDSVATDYAKVWVSLLSVRATDSQGNDAVLFDDPQGRVFNLAELDDIATLLNTTAISAETYQNFTITLDNDITLIAPNGDTTAATFGASGNTYDITVPGTLIVAGGLQTSLTFDFDLQRFDYNPDTGIVSATVVIVDESSRNGTYADIEGTVTAISAADQFTLAPEHSNTELNVMLHNNAVVTDESNTNPSSTGDTSLLTLRDYVEVYGNYDSSTLTLTAITVRIEDHDGDDNDDRGDDSQEVEGTVVSFDGSSLLINVEEADFRLDSNTLTIANASNAYFSHGDLGLLAEGRRVEVKGDWDGTTFTASLIEIEGASAAYADDDSDDDYGEIKGEVLSVNDTLLTLAPLQYEHMTPLPGSEISVDIANAWFEDGSAQCLANGTFVEAKGSVSGDTFIARTIEIENGCGHTTSDDDSADDSDSDDATEEAEAEGLITATGDNQFSLRLTEYEHFQPGSDTIDVNYANAHLEDGSLANIAVNVYVEVDGRWDGSVFIAEKIEFEW